MEFNEQARACFKAAREDPSNPKFTYELNSLYWSTIQGRIGDLILEEKDVYSFLDAEQDFINLGLVPELIENSEEIKSSTKENQENHSPLTVQTVTEWLKETIEKINQGNKKEFLERDIAMYRRQRKKAGKEIASIQEGRKNLLLSALDGVCSTPELTFINNLPEIDKTTLSLMRTKHSVAKGKFMSVPERRDLVAREAKVKEATEKVDKLYNKIKSDKQRLELRNYARQVNDLFNQIIDVEENIVKAKDEIGEIEKQQEELSPKEIQAGITKELDYLRDLMKLSAKRLRNESCPILRSEKGIFTWKQLYSCLDTILEFDPGVFRNDRASFIGKPSIMLVPGNGNALYDWKANRILVPLCPPAGNFMASIASAIIEYRIDVDDDKTMMNSYSKLPHLKGVRSLFQIRSSFTKDYTTWMTSEAKGFKVLQKETRVWFEHEIAPSKNEIYCPPRYQSFNLSSDQFRKLLEETESRLADTLAESAPDDLFVAGILNYQQGNFERAFDCIKAYSEKQPENPLGQYNLGQTGMKVSRKTEAINAFTEFYQKNPQSWWAGVAREHLRRLQMG
ncbi:MAG: hypothetical protein GF401_14890 [Chitinivibrionales bacterium]|nr:hypothetical protein [Chitinivibrionales bacterium]